jgi:hypothetical protein
MFNTVFRSSTALGNKPEYISYDLKFYRGMLSVFIIALGGYVFTLPLRL